MSRNICRGIHETQNTNDEGGANIYKKEPQTVGRIQSRRHDERHHILCRYVLPQRSLETLLEVEGTRNIMSDGLYLLNLTIIFLSTSFK